MVFDSAALSALGWRHSKHTHDSPDVAAARAVLEQRNGIAGLATRMVSPTEPDFAVRAARLFHSDGFVSRTVISFHCLSWHSIYNVPCMPNKLAVRCRLWSPTC